MKLFINLLIGLLVISILSCKSNESITPSEEPLISQVNVSIDDNTDDSENSISLDDAPNEREVMKELVEAPQTVVIEEAKVEDINDTELEAISAAEKRKFEELKLKIAKEKVENSKNKGKICADILNDYKALAQDFMKSRDMKILVEMNKYTNDVFFAKCREDKTFQKELDAINAEVDLILEE